MLPTQRWLYSGSAVFRPVSVHFESIRTSASVGFHSSTNSSVAPPAPRERISLMTTCPIVQPPPPLLLLDAALPAEPLLDDAPAGLAAPPLPVAPLAVVAVLALALVVAPVLAPAPPVPSTSWNALSSPSRRVQPEPSAIETPAHAAHRGAPLVREILRPPTATPA